jgi:preprotein translocase subunit SecE
VADESIERSAQPGRFGGWWRETQSELRRVVWPTREDAMTLTSAVLFVTVLMTVILGGSDLIFTRLIAFITSIVGGS